MDENTPITLGNLMTLLGSYGLGMLFDLVFSVFRK